MTNALTYPFARGQFVCKACQSLFYASREEVEFEDSVFWAACPTCGADSLETSHMRNLHRTIGSAKGANMSPAGRAKNRLNGFTTGSSSALPWYKNKIPMAPAKPGKYAECDSCQDLSDCESNVEHRRGTCVPVYCHRKMEVTLKYASAFLAGDPEMLRLTAANNAAQMQMLFNASIKKIFDRGVEVIETEFLWDEKGNLRKGPDGLPIEIEKKVYAHPLIKRCVEIMQTMGFTLGDWTMTPKSKEAKEQVAGFLAGFGPGSGKTAESVGDDIREKVDEFASLLEKAVKLRAGDKTLAAFKEESGKREGDD